MNLLKLPIIKNEAYFWIHNDYLYITNPMLKTARISAFFESDVPNTIAFGCSSQSIDTVAYCMNPLDKEYGVPGYLEKQVLELTSQKLLQTYFRINAHSSRLEKLQYNQLQKLL
jgi:hypothetical protein